MAKKFKVREIMDQMVIPAKDVGLEYILITRDQKDIYLELDLDSDYLHEVIERLKTYL